MMRLTADELQTEFDELGEKIAWNDLECTNMLLEIIAARLKEIAAALEGREDPNPPDSADRPDGR